MALPTSGALTLANIQTEFGGTNPIGLNEYYAGGGLVPAGTSGTYGAVPSSGALSVQNFYGTTAVVPAYIEDVFSTYLYTGNGSTQTITNGIDLSTKGGLVWLKARNDTRNNWLYNTVRGKEYGLRSDLNFAENYSTNSITAFNNNGFSIGDSGNINTSGNNLVSWSWAKAPKFFDVVTYTGTGGFGTFNHNLNGTAGMLIVKKTSSTGDWLVWHRSTGANTLLLNTTAAAANSGNPNYDQATADSSTFTVGGAYNDSGATYVAYLFAHNAGGFGLTGTDNVISCGSFTTDGSGNATVNLGYEPQWVLTKASSATSSWQIMDSMRGMPVGTTAAADGGRLYANLSAEEDQYPAVGPTSTGFTTKAGAITTSATIIYIAIRRGPMKVPTSGTSVFKAITRTGTGAAVTVSGAGFAPDLVATACRDFNGFGYYDKLRGALKALRPSQTSAEATYTTTLTGFTNTGYTAGSNSDGFGEINGNTDPYVNHMFARAPSFFDEVCYTGTGAVQNVPHNLGVVPEMLITKRRSNTGPWVVYTAMTGNTNYLQLYTADPLQENTGYYNSTTPTASVFTLGSSTSTNANANTFVAYLFATCAGVSKVGSYTGTGTTNQIDCGFTSGARFVMIKRTDNYNADVGNWYVWDSARGIVSGNDPYLFINSTAAEVTNTDYVDTYSAGFEISSTAPNGINQSGANYIYLAIA